MIFSFNRHLNFIQRPGLCDLTECKTEIMKIVDKNNDGKVSREELALLLSAN